MDNIVDLLLHRIYFINILIEFLIHYICNLNELNYTRYITGRGLSLFGNPGAITFRLTSGNCRYESHIYDIYK